MSFCQRPIISYLQQARGHRCDWLSGLDCSWVARELPVVYRGSKVSAKTPSTLICVSIETTTGKAGRMLMASQWACDTQPQLFVMEKLSWMNPFLIINYFHRLEQSNDAPAGEDTSSVNSFPLKTMRKVAALRQTKHPNTYRVDTYPNTWVLRLFIITVACGAQKLSDCLDTIWHECKREFICAIQTTRSLVLFMGCWKTYGGINLVTVLFNIASPRLGTTQQLEKGATAQQNRQQCHT